MEGDGEGLVAIVQGLENSGVTLTVCNRPRQNADRSRPSGTGQRIQINAVNQRSDLPAADQRTNTVPAVAAPQAVSTSPAVQRSSVETSTGTDFSRLATASQICDGRYASSYKMAHCMVNPTSPPEMVTEFPPQRKEPCRNQGNFEIGGQGSAQWSGHGVGHNASSHGAVPARVSTSRVKHYGGTQTWADKGSSHRYSKSNHRETEAFAHSLRKYPNMAPFRTASTDLIEKLLRFTQAKNYQEMSCSTKSMRSLRNQKSSDTCETVRASKHQQTYTRRQDENVTTNSNVQVGHRGRTKNFKLYSPISDSRNLRENRYRDTTFSSSYDYLKAGSPSYGRSNRSDGSPSPTYSRSPERRRSPEDSRSPDRSQSPEGSSVIRADRSSRTDRSLRFERSVRDLSLSEMSRYIRSTIKQICSERPVVVQVCPKLKDRFNQHRKVCPSKNERSSDVMEFEEEEEDPEDQASGSVLSRFLHSFSGRPVHSTEQAGCQCTRTDCYCTKATQCVNNPDVATSTAACTCTTANTSCCRGMPCVCAKRSQNQAYHKKRIDEEISEWLKDVPVTSIEDSESIKRRETIIKELRKTLKHLPDDENFEENAANEIQGFIDDFPVWNPGKDENDEKLFKNQLADKLTGKIIAIPRKPDRFRDIVRKWVANFDFEDDGGEIDTEVIIDNFVNRLKSLAADRPACDVKYTNILRKEIIELLVELALKFDGDMIMLKKMANNLAKEIVSIPKNVNLSGETDLTSEFEDNIADWICEHGLCKELKKDPKLIEGLAKKLNKIKSQGIYDDDVIEKMKEEVQQFVDDVGLAFETIDELIEELMNQLSSTIQIKEKERLDQEELTEEVRNWLRSLPGDDLHPRKLERITKDLVKMIQDSNEHENENLANDIVDYLVDTELSLDSADLGIYVEELMEKLNILPSNKFYKEQAKRMMLKEVLDIIECSPMPEDKKEKMRSKAKKIVESNLQKSSLNLIHAPDSVKEILLRDMDNAVSDIDIPKKSQSQLKSLLSTSINKNFDKSFKRLSREQSDLKQIIAKDVKNAVKELPIDAGKKKELMQKIKGSLSKNMNKPMPSNIEDNINDGISDIVEKCPICEDRNVLGRIKKVLSEVASKYLTIYLPPCVCDIQNGVEEDVGTVIDKSSIDTGQKRELKESIQDILTDIEDRRLSDEVVRTIQGDISSVVSDLSIPRDEKDYLKKAVSETVSKDFNEAGKSFRHDLNKIRNKLLDDITNVIEKSPIQRDVKSHLKDKLNTVLAKNLDSSLSDEEKHMILDDVSNILRDDMPEEQRINLTNKLAKKLDTHQRKEETKGLIETINRLSIDPRVKEDMKKEIKALFLETLYNPLSDAVQQKIEEDVFNAIDDMDIPEYDKKNLKSNMSHAMAKAINKLISQDIEEPQIKTTLQKIATNEMKKSSISKDEKEVLENRIKDVLIENLVRPVTDDVKETIKERLKHTVDDLISDKDKADAIKTQLLTVVNKDFNKSPQLKRQLKSDESFRDQKQTMDLKEIENVVLEMERAVDEALVIIPREKKNELKQKLKNIAIKNIEKPLDDFAEGLKDDINIMFNELNLPKDKKSKMKNALLTAVDKYMSNLQTTREDKNTEYPAKKQRPHLDTYKNTGKGMMPIEEVDASKVKDSIMKGIEKIIDKSAVPENKKLELKRKLKTLAAENLNKPFSQDVQDSIDTGIADIIDDQPIPKSEKIKLKSELTSIVDENVDNLRGEPRDQVSRLKESEDKLLRTIIKEIDHAIDIAYIPKEKKMELQNKLKNLAIKDFKKIPLEDVAEAIEDDMIEIIDELNLPKDKKNILKSTLLTAVGEYMINLQTARADKDTAYPARNKRPNFDTYKKTGKGMMPIEEVDVNKVKDSILKRIEKIIDKSAVPGEKKVELKRNLKTLAANNLKKPFSQDVQDTIETGIANIIDDVPISKSEKIKLKNELISMVDENVDNLRGEPRDQVAHLVKSEDIPLHNIFQEINCAIEEASIPKGKKQELKKKLTDLAAKDLKKIPSEDMAKVIEGDMIKIIDELNLPKDDKNKLKNKLLTAVGEHVSNLQTARDDKDTEYPAKKQRLNLDTYKTTGKRLMPIEEVDANKVKDIILKGIEKIIDKSAPEEKKVELKNKLKTLAAENLKKPFSQDVQESIETGMADIIDDLPISKREKIKLKSELTSIVHENVDNLRSKPRDQVSRLKESEDKPLRNIIQEIDRAIEVASIPKEKKIELKKELKNLATKDFKKIPLEDVAEAIEEDIIEIIDELNLPKNKKNKLKSTLLTAVGEYMSNWQTAREDIDTEYPAKKQRSNLDTYKTTGKRLMSIEEVDPNKDNILKGIEKIIDKSTVPEEKKVELQRKLKKVVAENLKKSFSEDAQEATKSDIEKILSDLPMPNSEKNKLKTELTSMVNKNMNNLGRKPRDQINLSDESENITLDNVLREMERTIEEAPREKKIETKKLKNETKDKYSSFQGLEKVIEDSTIPKGKKAELKRKLTTTAAENLKKPFSQNVQDTVKTGIADIIDELPISKSEKNKLTRELISVVDKNTDNLEGELRDQVSRLTESAAKPLKNIIQEIDRTIEEASIPKGKKKAFKKKLKNLASKDFKKIPVEDVAEAIEGDIIKIIDELNLPKSKANKLKSALLKAEGEYMSNLQTTREDKNTEYPAKKQRPHLDTYKNIGKGVMPIEEIDASKVKDSIVKGIEKIIDKSAVPENKKLELKRKLKTLAAENLNKPFSQDVQDSIDTGIADIIDNQPISKSEKIKLKSELTSIVDENVDNLRGEPRDQVSRLKESEDKSLRTIIKEIDHAIDISYIPKEKKIELKKKLKNLAIKDFKKIPLEDVAEAIEDDMIEIIDELNLPKDKKNILKSTLLTAVGEYMINLQTAREDKDTAYPAKNKRPNLDTYKKTDKGMMPIEEDSILKGIEKVIEKSTVPEEKKVELKRKLKTLAAKNLKKPFSQDVQDTIETGIADIINNLPISKSDKIQLQSELASTMNQNVNNLRGEPRNQVSRLKESEDKPLRTIIQEIDRAIEVASIPKEKKIELKKKLKNLATRDFKKLPSEEVAEAIEDDMVEIIDELNLPKDKKTKLKSTLLAAVGEYMSNLQTAREDKDTEYPAKNRRTNEDSTYNKIGKGLKPIEQIDASKVNILKGIEKIIDKSTVPEEKKVELQRKLKTLVAENLKKSFSEDAQEATKSGIDKILTDLPIPNSEINKLKSESASMVNENMDKLRSKPRHQIDHSEELDEKPQHNIFQEMELAINDAPLPKEKKMELKKMLQDLATKDFENKSLDEVAEALKDGMIEIIDELNLPKDKKKSLKNNLKNKIFEYMDILLDEPPTKTDNIKQLEDDTQKHILKGFEKVIDESPIPKENTLELKKKLIDLTTKNLNKPLSDEVTEALKGDINVILDELNLPKHNKNKLKNALTAVVDENMSNFKNENKLTKSSRYQHISPEKRRKISYPHHIIDETNLKESIKEEVKKSVLRSNVASSKKSKLNLDLRRMISDLLTEIDEVVDDKLKYIFEKYGIKPDYQKTLAEEFDKLLEIALRGGDFEDARRKLIAKLMRELNLSEEVASALTDEMIDMARKMAQQQGVVDTLKAISAPKISPNEQETKDKITECQEAFATAINNAIDQSTVSKPDKRSLKNKLLNKLQQTIDESPNKNNIGALKAEVLQESKKIVDASSIPAGKKKEIKMLLKKELAKAFGDEIIDDEESSDDGESDDFSEAIALQESPTPEEYREKKIAKIEGDIFKARPIVREQIDKITECKEAFAKAINNAIDQSSISKQDKSSLKNKLLNKLKQIIDESPNKNNIEALKTEVLQECKKIVDASSIPAGKKKEIKMLLKKELAKAFGDEIIDDEESSDDGESDDGNEAITLQEIPTPEEYREKIIECIKTWMDNLPMDFDPEVVEAVAEGLASDILDRQKYLQAHPEVISADNDEIENLKYQIFRRMNNVVDPKDMPLVMERTEELYRMIIGIEPPEGVPKLGQTSWKEQNSSQKRRRDQVPDTSPTLSTGNIHYSLKELIATNKSVRRQWSRHLDNALLKLPLLKSETKDLKDKLAIYDETGQINILSALSTTKEVTNTAGSSKSSKQVAPKPVLKNNTGKMSARLSKIEEAYALNNTTKQKTPFSPISNEPADVKEFTKKLKDTINTWLKKAKVEIDQNEKNRILEELAIDIIERQKYLQTFGETPTRSEDLEYLKLQTHRRLNGLVPVEVLKQIMEKIKDLIPQINNVKVPQLVQVPQKPPSRQVPQKPPSRQVPQKSSSPTRKLGPADILGIHGKATNTTRADGVPHTIDDDDGVEEESDTEFSPGQASTPSKSAAAQQEAADAEYFEKVTESVTNWLESMPTDLDPEVKSDVINELTSDIVDRQKYLQVHPDKKFSDDEEIENLRFQVFKRLDKILEPDSSATPSLAKIEELYKMIAGDGRKKSLTAKQAQEFQTALNEEISAVLNNYHICCDKRELLPKLSNELTKLRKSGADQDEIVENLIATIQPLTYLRNEDAEDLAYKLLYRTKKLIATIRGDVPVKKKDFREAMMNGDVFEGCPMSQSKCRLMESQLAEGYAKNLGIPLEESNATMYETEGPGSKKTSYGMSFNGLSNFIDTWLSSIHSEDDDTKDEAEIMDEKREKMYCLVHTIGEMNVDPEIFNDDSLYEAVLREELQHVLGDIKMDEEEFQALKEDLVEKVLEAQRRAHDEIAGQNYKKNLRDTLSKLLPDQRNLSREDQATIETLKDQLADAYIDLHFSGNNENQRDQLKRKITNEINTFCKNYLNRNPCSPLNSKTLNQELYTALNQVPLPPGDSIRYEVGQARIREEINDWVKELPLQPQSPTELLARNKLIYVLSKKLFDIELEEQEEDEDNELMRKHIVKFLNKLPLDSEEENDAIADTLINKLKASEELRKYNATSNVTIDAFGNVSAASNASSVKASICPGYKLVFDKRTPCAPRKVCARYPPRQTESIPPCTLSPEDRAHLEQIRRRTCLSPSCVTSLIKKHKCPTGAGPPPVNTGSQTVLRPYGIEEPQQNRICPLAYNKMHRPCPRVSANLPHQQYAQEKTESVEIEKPQSSSICPSAFEKALRICPGGPPRSPQSGQPIRRHTISSSNISECNEEVQPQILIKQYYWDPCDKTSVDDSEQQQSGRSSRRISDSPPCRQPGPCHPPRPVPCSSPKPVPCSLTRPVRPVPCSPPRPAPCRPTPCTSPRPATCRPPPCQPPRPPGCHPPGPCDPSPTCFSQPAQTCRRPSSAKLRQQSSPQSKSSRQNSSERYSYYNPQNSFQKCSEMDIPRSRSPCSPSPCMSSFSQYTPPGSPGYSKRFNECRMPKRDGLQDQVPSTSSRPSQKERVIELGSLDDVSGRPKKRPNDQTDWPKFHEEDHFWTAPMRRVILDQGVDESLVMESERREERVLCRCKERLVPKSGRPQAETCPSQPFSQSNEDGQNLKRCSKCCGIHCPYPSFLYFRQ